MPARPYFDDRQCVIYHGDCREILPGLGKFDLLLTDPPWGIGLRTDFGSRRGKRSGRIGKSGGKSGGSRRDHPEVTGDDRPFDPAHILDLAPNRILWGANNYSSRLPNSPCWLAWDRQTDGTDATDIELAWVSGHRFRTVRVFRHLWCGVRRATESAGHGGSWLHPMQKPVALMRWCLSFFPDAKTVIDPYMGSGPVARACKDAGLSYVGIEIEERYCQMAAKRLGQQVLDFGPLEVAR